MLRIAMLSQSHSTGHGFPSASHTESHCSDSTQYAAHMPKSEPTVVTARSTKIGPIAAKAIQRRAILKAIQPELSRVQHTCPNKKYKK